MTLLPAPLRTNSKVGFGSEINTYVEKCGQTIFCNSQYFTNKSSIKLDFKNFETKTDMFKNEEFDNEFTELAPVDIVKGEAIFEI